MVYYIQKTQENIHIHKTGDDGKEVDINIDKNKKTVNVNVNKDEGGKKTNVKIEQLSKSVEKALD